MLQIHIFVLSQEQQQIFQIKHQTELHSRASPLSANVCRMKPNGIHAIVQNRIIQYECLHR